MQLRAFLASDAQGVIQLWKDCALLRPWNNPELNIQRKLKVDPDLFIVCTKDGRIIGSVMAGYEGHRGWINYLAVHPEFRRQGIARQLMQEVELRLKEKGCPKINLQVRAENTDVIAFYKALGFLDDKVIGLGKRLATDKPYVHRED